MLRKSVTDLGVLTREAPDSWILCKPSPTQQHLSFPLQDDGHALPWLWLVGSGLEYGDIWLCAHISQGHVLKEMATMGEGESTVLTLPHPPSSPHSQGRVGDGVSATRPPHTRIPVMYTVTQEPRKGLDLPKSTMIIPRSDCQTTMLEPQKQRCFTFSASDTSYVQLIHFIISF